MSEKKVERRELLRPLHLLGIALACGVFAAAVTLVSTGAFTSRVNAMIANGTYEGLTPVGLGLVVGGGNWRVTLTTITRTREFEGQDEGDQFGSISVSYRM